MHYHAEIIMPLVNDVEKAVGEILSPFDENAKEPLHAFWDWWQIGGRYSGCKLEARVGSEKLAAFHEELKRRKVTVSGIQFGKQELQPASQIEMVDELWRDMCPGGGDVCPIFQHSGKESTSDICAYSEIPPELSAYRLIVAAPDYEGKAMEAVSMFAKSIWNGVMHEDTKWSGSVAAGLKLHLKQMKHYKSEYAKKITPQPDWLVVTVDYHS